MPPARDRGRTGIPIAPRPMELLRVRLAAGARPLGSGIADEFGAFAASHHVGSHRPGPATGRHRYFSRDGASGWSGHSAAGSKHAISSIAGASSEQSRLPRPAAHTPRPRAAHDARLPLPAISSCGMTAFPTPWTARAKGGMNDDARLWHPWLRMNRVLRVMLQTSWSTEAWAQVRLEFRRALALRSEIRRAGWFN